jgi:hypothetical protein
MSELHQSVEADNPMAGTSWWSPRMFWGVLAYGALTRVVVVAVGAVMFLGSEPSENLAALSGRKWLGA